MSLVVMADPHNYNNPMAEQLAYDLRQRYAVIVGDHLQDVATFRKERNYPEYFRALEDLYVIIQHKFKDPKKKKKKEKVRVEKDEDKKKDEKGEDQSYSALRQTLINVSNEFSEEWKGSVSEPENIAKIEDALRCIEKFLYKKMDEAKMFGGKGDQEHLY